MKSVTFRVVNKAIKMKILSIVTISVIIIGLFGVASFCAENFSPYDYFPQGTYQSQDQLEQEPHATIEILPYRPLVIRDSDGNKMYVSSKGKVMLKIDKQGNRTFFVGGLAHHETNSNGGLTKKWKHIQGTNKVEVQNEFGEQIGMQKLGLGNKVVSEYDEKSNLTRSYKYNKYGKRMAWIVDELTLTKTECDEQGKPLWDIDFEGYKVAWYSYNEKGKLALKEDVYGNKTYYNRDGMQYTVDYEGNTIATYHYDRDEHGYLALLSVKDEITGNVTIYNRGRPNEVRNSVGTVIKKYEWEGTKLIYTLDVETNEVTWYDNGRPTYVTYDDSLERQWFYLEGKLAGVWSPGTSSFLLYTHGRKEIEFLCEDKPEEAQLHRWIVGLQ